jgi:periplasmic mercuric ion binding protein
MNFCIFTMNLFFVNNLILNRMKNLKNICFTLVVALAFVSCKQENSELTSEITKKEVISTADLASMQTASFTIDGMTCAVGCAKTIENKLANQEGVGQAVVDFESKIATVKFDAKKQSLESLTTTIEAVAGGDSYKVTESKKM